MGTSLHRAVAASLKQWHSMIASGDLSWLPALGEEMGARIGRVLPAFAAAPRSRHRSPPPSD